MNHATDECGEAIMDSVLLDRDGSLAWLTLNRPEKRNALSVELMKDMLEKLQVVAGDPEISVVIIRGAGKVFSAGHDLQEMVGEDKDIHDFREVFGICSKMMLRLQEMPQPVIAQVHGIATAAGCQLVAACDLAVAESGAQFATPGVKIGLFCTTPMVPLFRAVGRKRALDMLLTGRFISTAEAERFGLVNRVVPLDQLAVETTKLALEMAQYSKFTLSLGKQAFYSQLDMNEKCAYQYAKEVIAMNCAAADAQEGMQAFLQKRAPKWQGR